MEVPGGKRNKLFVCLYEALGCCVLTMVLNWTVQLDTFRMNEEQTQPSADIIDRVEYKSVQLTLALALTFVTILFGQISGGHFNPAVTFAMLFQESDDEFESKLADSVLALIIICCQCIGGFLGLFLSLMALPWNGDQAVMTRVLVFSAYSNKDNYKPEDYQQSVFWRVVLVEMVMTSIFICFYI